PQGRNPVKTKYEFKIKPTVEGTIEQFKARLVEQGSTQREGVEYYNVQPSGLYNQNCAGDSNSSVRELDRTASSPHRRHWKGL
ncbi:unnamed protein product, partial [Choristocarpus tenellus]